MSALITVKFLYKRKKIPYAPPIAVCIDSLVPHKNLPIMIKATLYGTEYSKFPIMTINKLIKNTRRKFLVRSVYRPIIKPPNNCPTALHVSAMLWVNRWFDM